MNYDDAKAEVLAAVVQPVIGRRYILNTHGLTGVWILSNAPGGSFDRRGIYTFTAEGPGVVPRQFGISRHWWPKGVSSGAITLA